MRVSFRLARVLMLITQTALRSVEFVDRAESAERAHLYHVNDCVYKQRRGSVSECVCVSPLSTTLCISLLIGEGGRETESEGDREREKGRLPLLLPVSANCVHSKYFHNQSSHGNRRGGCCWRGGGWVGG